MCHQRETHLWFPWVCVRGGETQLAFLPLDPMTPNPSLPSSPYKKTKKCLQPICLLSKCLLIQADKLLVVRATCQLFPPTLSSAVVMLKSRFKLHNFSVSKKCWRFRHQHLTLISQIVKDNYRANSFFSSFTAHAFMCSFILTGSPRGPKGPSTPLGPGSPGSPYKDTERERENPLKTIKTAQIQSSYGRKTSFIWI